MPPLQIVPQLPQLALSVCSSTQVVPHTDWPATGHAHAPAVHVCALEQTVPQAPQLSGSVAVSVQVPLHTVWPVEQVQTPATQLVPPLHATPQPPQLALSVFGLTHAVPHWRSPVAQMLWHWPFEQT